MSHRPSAVDPGGRLGGRATEPAGLEGATVQAVLGDAYEGRLVSNFYGADNSQAGSHQH